MAIKRLAIGVLAAVLAAAISGYTPILDVRPAAAADPVFVGAGDIANCKPETDATARLLDSIAGTVFTTGDNAYDDGSAADFQRCYNPSWGRHKSRTRPTPGNHEYHTSGASGYFGYFGAAAGEQGKGYYSYQLGAWHIIALNGNCEEVSCSAGSPQERWLRAELAASSSVCTLAYWHAPLFSSGQHGGDTAVRPLWQALYDDGADVILAVHDHDYERFEPQDPTGRLDTSRGIRQFVVGTGGAGVRPFGSTAANSEARNATDHGVLKLTLGSSRYTWEFVPIAGKSYRDTGSANCVGASGPTPTPSPTPKPTPTPRPTATPGATPTPSPSPSPRISPLKNPSFELDANGNGRPDDWSSSKLLRSNRIAAHQGAWVGELYSSSESSASADQNVGIVAGSTYAASCWTSVATTSDSFTFNIEVRWIRDGGGTVRVDVVRSFADDSRGAWTQASRSLNAPAGAAKAELRLLAVSFRGSIYVDDCSFGPS